MKLGLAILGMFRGEVDRETFLVLGRHDEFTLFAAVALSNSLQDPEPALFRLAKSVDGWGRIQPVERLRSTKTPEIKGWLLRDGYRNSIMFEYLAHLCATTGGLTPALEVAEIDDALLDGAADILGALTDARGGPFQGMDDYPDGAAATTHYLRHLRGHIARAKLGHVGALGQLATLLDDETADWGARASMGWTPGVRRDLRAQVRELLAAPRWLALIEDGLAASDAAAFHQANQAATVLGIDTWERHFARAASGWEGSNWYAISHTKDPDRMRRVVALAERQLPLDQIATGPGRALGLGPAWKPHGTLDVVLQELGAFPGLGWPLVQAGLKSPVIRNRNLALQALADWGRPRWPEQVEGVLREARRLEPDSEVRARIDDVLSGRPWADRRGQIPHSQERQ